MNKSNVGASTNFMQIVLDVVDSFVAFLIVSLIFWDILNMYEVRRCFVVYLVFIVIYILTNKDNRVYNITTFFYMDRIFKNVTKSFVLSSSLIGVLLFYVADNSVDKAFFSTFLAFAYMLLLIGTFVFRYIYKLKMHRFFPRTAYVGSVAQFKKFDYFMNKTNIGINFIGYISPGKVNSKNEKYIGGLDELEELIKEHSIDQVYIMQTKTGKTDMQDYIDLCMEMGVTVRMVMDFYKDGVAKSYMSSVGTYPVVTFHTISLNDSERVIKRCMDVIGAMVGIILSSPIMLVTAVLIKLTSPGEVIFKQRRVGMNGRIFHIYKFRTMYQDAEARKAELMAQNEVEGGLMFKMKSDPRITPVGKFLRKTSIDELPQFFNVLLGSMSLVGTRPPTEDEVKLYERNHWRRISIKPGITGMWQVSGRSRITSFDEIVELDTKYIDEWSVMMDIKVIFKTVQVIFMRDGAY